MATTRKKSPGVRAVGRYLRVSPRKARVVADMIRGKDVEEAMNILSFVPRRACKVIEKVLTSAVANAETSPDIEDPDALYIREIMVDGGPVLKRYRPRAMGRATMIRKRTSHITIVLDERRSGR